MRTASRIVRLLVAPACLLALSLSAPVACAQDKPAAAPLEKVGKLPHVEFNVDKKQVRVECESLAVDAPLEFFICNAGGAEHEAVMRTRAKPSHIHTGLLAIGVKPGQPLTFLEATKKWIPPQGSPLHLTVEYMKDGKVVSYPAYRWIRNVKTKKEPRAFTWIFAGSRVTQDGKYGADETGYIVTLVNFDFAMIDVPDLASNANDLLEWERNADLMPPKGTQVWLVIEPAGAAKAGDAAPGAAPGGQGAAPAVPAGPRLSDVEIDQQRIDKLIKHHTDVMGPRAEAIKAAAEAHYKVIAELRAEQQRLITEADRIQRAIDELERKWADVVTPRPELDPQPAPAPAPGLP